MHLVRLARFLSTRTFPPLTHFISCEVTYNFSMLALKLKVEVHQCITRTVVGMYMRIIGTDLQLPAKAGTNLSTPQRENARLASGAWDDQESNLVHLDHKSGILANTHACLFLSLDLIYIE
jgi:hypothetical protein